MGTEVNAQNLVNAIKGEYTTIEEFMADVTKGGYTGDLASLEAAIETFRNNTQKIVSVRTDVLNLYLEKFNQGIVDTIPEIRELDETEDKISMIFDVE